ncbi:MAG: hypothetical protein HY257_05915 [Chloroflexi bacterium]|nr:hypothetical protein [Chloroflexota bacterium]
MTREEILALCAKAPNVGAVKHEEFADYIVVLESQKRHGDEWQTVAHAYMAVDGKLAMANEDHRKQSKRLDFSEPKVLLDNAEQLTLQVMVSSEMYGSRHGIATSRKKGGTRAEQEFPWEVAETSAIGRALAAMGYGLLPGAGLASAEDIMRVSATSDGARKESRKAPLMSANQRTKLIELYREQHGGSEAEAIKGLDALFASAFKHGFAEATVPEASDTISKLIAQKQARAKK